MTATTPLQRDSPKPPSAFQFKRSINRPRWHNFVFEGAESNIGNRPLAGEDRQYTCTIRPNGSGTIGIRRRKGELSSERTHQTDRKAKAIAVQYLDYDQYEGEDNVTRVVRCELHGKQVSPLTLSEVPTGRKAKPRIAKSLTRHGKRTLDSGTKLLEKRYGIRNLGFYTLTCPMKSPEDVKAFNEAFPTIVKRFLERLKRNYEKKGIKFSYVGVHEVQPKRFQTSGIAALHFHYVAPARQGRRFKFIHTASEIRAIYHQCIKNALPNRDVPNPRVGVELCRISAASYLAKYYSKGFSQKAEQLDDAGSVVLSSWYSVSRSLLLLIRAVILKCDDDFAASVISHHYGQCESRDISFSRCVKRLHRDAEIIVGYVFTMNAGFMSAWLEHCRDVITEAI